ncbi:MAG: hypothetical protein KDI19_06665 [Pseudomonadales bacterium]|nr:hypothetical protein [Pseudomonadales bacterium]
MSERRRIFLVPMAYFFATRLSGVFAAVSWIAIYPLAIAVSAVLYVSPFDLESWLGVVLAMLAVYSLYELGYMDNDTRTVARESSPTERLTDTEKRFFLRYRWRIVVFRLVFVAALLVCIRLLVPYNVGGFYGLLAGLGAIAVGFVLYNSTRGRLNLPLHGLLVGARFCTPGLIVVPAGRWEYLTLMLVAFPLPNLVERAGEGRYDIQPLARVAAHRDGFRVIYYSLALFAAAALFYESRIGILSLIVLAWFFLVRLAGFVASRLGARGA